MVGSKTTKSSVARLAVIVALSASNQLPLPLQQNYTYHRVLVPSHPDQVRVSQVARSVLINSMETLVLVLNAQYETLYGFPTLQANHDVQGFNELLNNMFNIFLL